MIVDTKGRILKARNVWFEQVSSVDDIPKDGTDIVYIYGVRGSQECESIMN